MSQFALNQLLVCVPELDLSVTSDRFVQIRLGKEMIKGGRHTLAILDTFQKPILVEAALTKLNANVVSTPDWIELTTTLMNLYESGVLIDPEQIRPDLSEKQRTFDAASIHITMLNDLTRTQTYLEAIRATVLPGDVVIDLGTGTGVLAIAAAQAGASRVYAIEAGGIGEAAQANFETNQVADRITLVRGFSTGIVLPEKADVLVSEIIGSDPLSEGILVSTSDAVHRFLKPEARLIPYQMRLYAQVLTLPDEKLDEYFFTARDTRKWKMYYGIDFSALNQITTKQPFQVYVKPHEPRGWPRLSEAVLLETVDFRTHTQTMMDRSVFFSVDAPGYFDAVLIYPDVDLTANLCLTRAPQVVDEGCHWYSPLWLLPKPFEVQPDDQFRLTCRYGAPNKRFEIEVSRA